MSNGLIEQKFFGPDKDINVWYFEDGDQVVRYPTNLTEFVNANLLRSTVEEIAGETTPQTEIVGYYEDVRVIDDYFDVRRARMGAAGAIMFNADVIDSGLSVVIAKYEDGSRSNEIIYDQHFASQIAEPLMRATVDPAFIDLVPEVLKPHPTLQ